jgi:hypothetical protein
MRTIYLVTTLYLYYFLYHTSLVDLLCNVYSTGFLGLLTLGNGHIPWSTNDAVDRRDVSDMILGTQRKKKNSNFLYLCAQIRTPGAINVTKNRMEKYIHITVRDRFATRRTAEIHNPAVINSHSAFEHDDWWSKKKKAINEEAIWK